MRLRPSDTSDAAAIAAVHVEAWREAYAGVVRGDVLAALSGADREKAWKSSLADPARPFLVTVAELDGKLVGFCARCVPTRDEDEDLSTGEIAALYVTPTYWGCGVGGALLRDALGQLDAEGCPQVTLWTFDANDRARGFYERFGFMPDGTSRPPQDGRPSEVRMRLKWGLRQL